MNLNAIFAKDTAAELGLELTNLHSLAEDISACGDYPEAVAKTERRAPIVARIDQLFATLAQSKAEGVADIQAAADLVKGEQFQRAGELDRALRGE